MLEQGLKGYLLLGLEPERDAWDPQAARHALARSEFAAAITAYTSPAMEEWADVMLPMGLFPETSGTLVNGEGRWQGFPGALAPVGEARPAWKILRVLGNGLALPGFDYVSSEEVLEAVRVPCEKVKLDTLHAGAPGEAPDPGQGLERIGEIPIYGVDPLVRHADALQETPDAVAAGRLWLAPATAAEAGLAEGDLARVRQGEAGAELRVALSDGVAPGCALVYRATEAGAALGPAFGPVTVEKAG
jgi:NADH-quinone oxidoreductase subunit G